MGKTTAASNTEQPKPDDMEDLKKAMSFISAKLYELLPIRQEIAQVLCTVKRLERENAEKESKIKTLESRLDHLEQYSRLENIVISGLEINHRKYNSAATP